MLGKVSVCVLAHLAWTAAADLLRTPSTGSPHAYDPEEARKFASLSEATYCDGAATGDVMNWTCGPCKESKTPLVPGRIKAIDSGDKNAVRIIVGKLRDQDGCLVAFRGTSNSENWVRDLQFWTAATSFPDCDGCRVHSGFLAVWNNVKAQVTSGLSEVGCAPDTESKDNLLFVTGHSLGAALTHLAMFSFESWGFKVATTYSFEAPRVGNQAFSDAFSDRFERRFPVFRITHYKDPCVHLPFESLGYKHVQTEVYYDDKGQYKICQEREDPTCAGQFSNVPDLLLLHGGDHCSTSLTTDGNICNCGSGTSTLLV